MTEQQIEEIIESKLGLKLPQIKRKWFLLGALTALLIPLTIWAATISKPHTFSDGDTLSASKLNENFDALYAKVNELDSLLPVGTILGWHKSMPNTPQSLPTGWVECNGQTLSDTGSVYNGQIIPNLNGAASGANSPGQTAKEAMFLRGGQVSGNGQTDAFQGHWHKTLCSTGGSGGTFDTIVFGTNVGCTPVDPRNNIARDVVDDGTNGVPRIASETRTKNMSVVWLIRVK